MPIDLPGTCFERRAPELGPTQCAVLTPAGRGAIATLGVRGATALAIVARLFEPATGQPLESFDSGRAVFGRFQLLSGCAEELVVGLVAPNEIEIHCHGGIAAAAAVRDALISEDCHLLQAADWAHGQARDVFSAQAQLALAEVRTERTAAVILDQYRGALRAELLAIGAQIARGGLAEASQKARRLLKRAPLGLHLVQPWQVVLAGRPNAGKSTLINALLGYQRAIVWHQPGTTRDVLTAGTAIDGWPVELADTAGLRRDGEAIEAQGVARAYRQIAVADLLLFVADTTARWDDQLFRELSNRSVIVIHNKCDLAAPARDDRPGGIEVSAKTGRGIDELCAAISQSLVPDPPARGAAVPFTYEQVAALQELVADLDRHDQTAALESPLLRGLCDGALVCNPRTLCDNR